MNSLKNMPQSIEKLVIALGQQLKAQAWKLASAESCTGGGLAYWVTSIAGSSEWFERGFVTYSNSAKEEMLGVNPATLAAHGAVSAAVAQEMAEGVLRFSKADISVAITGIAGPGGGTPEKPIGTVWFAWAGRKFETKTKVAFLTGNRSDIRNQAIHLALENLLELTQP
jgi:nicotinamide-nucleotide amidase